MASMEKVVPCNNGLCLDALTAGYPGSLVRGHRREPLVGRPLHCETPEHIRIHSVLRDNAYLTTADLSPHAMPRLNVSKTFLS